MSSMKGHRGGPASLRCCQPCGDGVSINHTCSGLQGPESGPGRRQVMTLPLGQGKIPSELRQVQDLSFEDSNKAQEMIL